MQASDLSNNDDDDNSIPTLGGCILVAPAAVSSSGGDASTDTTIDTQLSVASDGEAVGIIRHGIAALVMQGGIEYVEQCVGFPQPGALCADRDAVRAGLSCAFGVGRQCRPCPAGAVCPGGFKAQPLPGYWTGSESSGVVILCEPPAEDRCRGWDGGTDTSLCGEGYRQGSSGCSRCEEGRYPESDGSCQMCPSSPSAWLLL